MFVTGRPEVPWLVCRCASVLVCERACWEKLRKPNQPPAARRCVTGAGEVVPNLNKVILVYFLIRPKASFALRSQHRTIQRAFQGHTYVNFKIHL